MTLDDMFKHPERYAVSDAQFEKVLEQRDRERRLKAGLAGLAIVVGAVVIFASVLTLTISGVFGG